MSQQAAGLQVYLHTRIPLSKGKRKTQMVEARYLCCLNSGKSDALYAHRAVSQTMRWIPFAMRTQKEACRTPPPPDRLILQYSEMTWTRASTRSGHSADYAAEAPRLILPSPDSHAIRKRKALQDSHASIRASSHPPYLNTRYLILHSLHPLQQRHAPSHVCSSASSAQFGNPSRPHCWADQEAGARS